MPDNYTLKLGSANCEFISGIEFSDTDETAVAHNLGATPDIVIVIPTNESYVVAKTGTDTSSNIYLTAEHADATCNVLVIKKDKHEV